MRYRGGSVVFASFVSGGLQVMLFFFFQAEDGIRDADVTGVQTCALPIWDQDETGAGLRSADPHRRPGLGGVPRRSEEHTSELQSRPHLVCRLLLEKKVVVKDRAFIRSWSVKPNGWYQTFLKEPCGTIQVGHHE